MLENFFFPLGVEIFDKLKGIDKLDSIKYIHKQFSKLFIVPIKNEVILAYHWSIKMYTGQSFII